jgi:hypothetical protein
MKDKQKIMNRKNGRKKKSKTRRKMVTGQKSTMEDINKQNNELTAAKE